MSTEYDLPAINQLIAEKVMGITVTNGMVREVWPASQEMVDSYSEIDPERPALGEEMVFQHAVDAYTTSIVWAYTVVQKLVADGWWISVGTDSEHSSVCAWKKGNTGSEPDVHYPAETAPLAICLAALRAVGIEVA